MNQAKATRLQKLFPPTKEGTETQLSCAGLFVSLLECLPIHSVSQHLVTVKDPPGSEMIRYRGSEHIAWLIVEYVQCCMRTQEFVVP